MRPLINHELFSSRDKLTPTAWVGIALLVVLLLGASLGWGRFSASLEDRYQTAYGAARFDEAVAVARRMIEEDPGSADAWNALAAAYLEKSAHGSDREASIDAALEAANSAERLDRGNALTQRLIGTAYAMRGDYATALERFRVSMLANPQDSMAIALAGLAYERQGLTDRATAYYESATRDGAGDGRASLLYARSLIRAGDTSAGIREAERAAADPTPFVAAEANALLSSTRLAGGEMRAARAAADRAMELAPNLAEVLVASGEVSLAEVFVGKTVPLEETLASVRAKADLAAATDPTLARAPFLAFKAAYSQNDTAAAAAYAARIDEILADDATLTPAGREAIRTFIRTVSTIEVSSTR